MTRARRPVIAVAALAAVLLAGCTSGSSGKGTATTSATSSDVLTTEAPTTSAPESPTYSPTTSTAPTSAPPSTKASTAAAGDGCTLAQLELRAIRGSGAQQREFAQITFTNKSSKACTLFGFPGVSLRRGGAIFGSPATREPVTASTVRLRPGEQGYVDVTDFSSCQAPLSDTVRIYPPDSTQFVDLPLDIRGCSLTIKPIVHA